MIEALEAAARAMRGQFNGNLRGIPLLPWEELPEEQREMWRAVARVGIAVYEMSTRSGRTDAASDPAA